VESAYHDIALARSKGVYRLQPANGAVEMDRDFVLSWRPVSGGEPAAALFTEEVAGQHYGMLLLLPPAPERAAASPPRELVFVVDTSGSMGGVSIRQAREAMGEALRQLRPEDSFNIIEFNTGWRKLYRRAMPANRHHVQQATEFVRQLQASGGTEMLPALQAALSPADPDLYRERKPLRQVIFITDGAVGNEQALFEAISARLGDQRLFTVGIGSAPNSWFMRKAAEYGRGTHTHIGDVTEVRDKMSALYAQLSRPAALNLQVHWPQAVEAWPQRLPDLYLGEPLTLAVNFGSAAPAGEIRIEGELAGQPWQRSLLLQDAADPQHQAGHPGVASLWARRKITGLLDQKVSGRPEQEVRAEVLPLALQHQLLSPYTSFVAVEEIIARPATETTGGTPVPNSRPRGQSDQSFAWPRTATTGPARAWFGALLLSLALLVWVMGRPEVDHVAPQQV
jgi:Ca-activated chloride channel family protein